MTAPRLGFMQGRLTPSVDGRIQDFPWEHWREEFPLAQANGFDVIEWVLDLPDAEHNPFLTPEGQGEISQLSSKHSVTVESVCVDWLMATPLADKTGTANAEAVTFLGRVIDACQVLGVRYLEIPLVDNSRISSDAQRDAVVAAVSAESHHASKAGVTVVLETDLPPREFVALLERFEPPTVRANYDMGNSASLGYEPADELAVLGAWIANVHVKDRVKGGGTVPLGTGDADLPTVFAGLANARYAGTYILQTARQPDDVAAARAYRSQVLDLLGEAEVSHGS
jgi:L-ribulose-5-phosphate 3-epimerase